jgi:hypothetical protein
MSNLKLTGGLLSLFCAVFLSVMGVQSAPPPRSSPPHRPPGAKEVFLPRPKPVPAPKPTAGSKPAPAPKSAPVAPSLVRVKPLTSTLPKFPQAPSAIPAPAISGPIAVPAAAPKSAGKASSPGKAALPSRVTSTLQRTSCGGQTNLPRGRTGQVEIRGETVPMQRLDQSPRGRTMSNVANWLANFMEGANRWSVERRVASEINRLRPEIRRTMPAGGGVLLVITTARPEVPDPAGPNARLFLGVHVGGSGTDFSESRKRYLEEPGISVGAPRGWVTEREFRWVTNAN